MTADGVPPSAAVVASRYRFDDVVVDLGARTLVRAGELRTLEPKAFAVLALLLERAGELVPRDDLLDAVWGHRHVTPGVLTRVIAQLRHALDDDAQHPRYIQTRHALGYSFIGELLDERMAAADTEAEPAAERAPLAARGADTALPLTADASAGPVEQREMRGAVAPSRRRAAAIAFACLALLALVAAIAWWRRPPAPLHASAPSVAVRAFTTTTADPADRYFAEGLAVEMHNALAGVHGLQVAAWAPDAAIDPLALGRRLGVASVLDGRVQRIGNRVRVDARLLDVPSGGLLWSRSYDRPLRDVFELQSSMASEVAAVLVGALPDAGEGLRRRLAPTRDVAAFDAYLHGLYELFATRGDRPQAIGYFRKALVRDPGFARAQAAICRTEAWRFESQRNPKAFDSARLACRTAENMDPGIGEVQLAFGDLYRVNGSLEKAGEYYRHVVDYPGQRADALVGLAKVDVARDRIDDALAHFREALRASPSDAHIYAELGYQQYVAGRTEDAVASLEQATRLAPEDGDFWGLQGALLLSVGRTDAAEKALERAVALDPDDRALANLGTIKYERGDYAAAAVLYRRAIALSPDTYINYGNLGDALLADARTAGQAPAAFRQAADLAQHFIDFNGGDAMTLAALGWYRANIGERERALALARQAESKGEQAADVAFYNAETLLQLGDVDGARQRIEMARHAGIAEKRLATNPLFTRAGVVATR
ncbi:tetratricopeptide repeat protein [Lysobacter claricitrinus]|uniref:tetratricopeptide repeat protein n=1 Tax=Lysobacter claricitrinus TaxID=3367728 RepID=UPI0037DBB031